MLEEVLHIQLAQNAILSSTVLIDMKSNHHIVVDASRRLHAF